MTAIIAALLCEAQAIATKYDIKLQKELGFIFGANQDIAIIISGVGSAKMSCAVGFMQAKFAPNFWINIGVAGSINRRIGELFWIDKISKEKYNFYPDILLKTNLQFAPLYSCDIAKISNADTDMLYDMEGYDFANTASMFCGINKIAILKIVSDNCDNTLLTPQFVATLMEQKISEIVSKKLKGLAAIVSLTKNSKISHKIPINKTDSKSFAIFG